MDEKKYRRSFRQSKQLSKTGLGDLIPFEDPDVDELKSMDEEQGSGKWYSDQISGTEKRISFAEVQMGEISSVEIEKYQDKFLRRRRRIDEAILQRSPKE